MAEIASQRWSAERYAETAHFVPALGAPLLELLAVPRHPGAPHDEHVGTVLVAQPAADIDHAGQGRASVGELGDAEADRQIAGEALIDAHRCDVAQMPRHRARQDRDHAKPVA